MTPDEGARLIREEVARAGKVTSTAIELYASHRLRGSVFAQACREGIDDHQRARQEAAKCRT